MSKVKIEEELKDNVEGSESEKLVNEDSEIVQTDNENNSTGEITLEQFKNALENNIECKGYFDSLCDKTVNTRLDKGIESWKTNNLENIVNEEVNKRYPQKSKTEIALEKAMEEKRQLELQVKYQNLMAENNLPMDIIDFVAGKDVESTISNIGKFKSLTESYIDNGIQKEVNRRMKEFSYIPPGDNGCPSDYAQDIWKMLK